MLFHFVFLSVVSLNLFAEAPADNFDDLLKTLNRPPVSEESLPAPTPIPELKPRELPMVRESTAKSSAPVVPNENLVPPPAPETVIENVSPAVPDAPVYGPQPTVAQSFLVPQSDEFGDIYLAMLFKTNQRGQAFYAPAVGHSVAAATLVVCAPELTPVEKLEAMHSVLNHLERVRVRSIAAAVHQGGRTWHPQLTQIAATLVCKMRTRTDQGDGLAIVQELVEAYKELVGRFNARRPDLRLEESLSNLQVAATLLN